MLYFNESVSHQFGGNVKSIFTIWRKSLSQLLWATFGTPRGMALTAALLPISVCSFHEHIYAESQRMFPCSLVSASFCYDKTKRQPGFVAYSQGFKKKKKKKRAPALWELCNQTSGAFSSWLCHGTIRVWIKQRIDEIKWRKKGHARWTSVLVALPPSFFPLDNGSAKMKCQSVQTNGWTSGNSHLKQKKTIKKKTRLASSVSPQSDLNPPLMIFKQRMFSRSAEALQLIKYISREIMWSLYIHICPGDWKSSIWSSSHARRHRAWRGAVVIPFPAALPACCDSHEHATQESSNHNHNHVQ